MEPLTNLSATLTLTDRENRAQKKIKMVVKFVVWYRLKLSGGFILQLPVSTSFD